MEYARLGATLDDAVAALDLDEAERASLEEPYLPRAGGCFL